MSSLLKIENVSVGYGKNQVLKNVNAEIDNKGSIHALIGPSGIGKCFAPNTQVLMYDGTIKFVQDIIAGDSLMGPDSRPRVVLALGHGYDEMYDIVPVKGEIHRVNSAHILALMETQTAIGGRCNNPIEISLADYKKTNIWFKARTKLYRTGVKFFEKIIELDPYVLGLWLGDGHSDGARITSQDVEVVDGLYEYAAAIGGEVSVGKSSGKVNNYNVNGRWGRGISTESKLRAINVLNNKHIPHNYKANSEKIRLEILAGLMDSDGSLTSGNCFDFSSKNEQLADDVAYIARSLSLAAYVKPCVKSCQTGASDFYWRVIISGNIEIIPTRIERKKAQLRRQIKNVLYTGFKIESAGYGEYYGFQLDGDGLFLLGDFTVTHNTTLFRTISGLDSPTTPGRIMTGKVTLNGFDRPVHPGEVGVVAQSYPLFEHRTVFGNLMLAARRNEKNEKAAHDKVIASLANFELGDKSGSYPCELSGGQRQRCSIIQQMLSSQHFILMDEPFSGLDPVMKEKTIKLIQKVANTDDFGAIILTTHDIQAAIAVADQIWVFGRDCDATGCKIPGAYIVKQYCMAEHGIVAGSANEFSPQFIQLVQEIKGIFNRL